MGASRQELFGSYLKDLDVVGGSLRLEDPPRSESIAHLLSGADLLVLPFNFDERSRQYIRLSMPTKVPAYMACGTPVLVYGPPGIATVRYAQRDGWGHVLSTPGLAPLQETLLWLLEDRTARERLGKRAKVLAHEHHDAGKVRPAFHSALVKAAAGNCFYCKIRYISKFNIQRIRLVETMIFSCSS